MVHDAKAAPPGGALDLVVVGHVTRDLIEGEERLGGAAAFSALAAARMGLRVGLVTAARAGDPILAPLASDPAIAMELVGSAETTSFALDYSGPERTVHLLSRACDLLPRHVPAHWRQAPLAYVVPVIGECGADIVEALGAERVAVGAQGWLRAVAPGGRVEPALRPEAEQPPRGLLAVIYSEKDHPDAEALAAHFAAAAQIVALTRGDRGSTLLCAGERHEIAAAPATERDPTGAGDVYGLALALSRLRGAEPVAAARAAAQAAARVVEGPGLGELGAPTRQAPRGAAAGRRRPTWEPA